MNYDVAPTSLTFPPRTVLLESKDLSPDSNLEGLESHLPWRNEETDIWKDV